MSDKSKYSSGTDPLEGPPANPAVFPCVMLGTAMFLGVPLYLGDVEGRLSGLFVSSQTAVSFYRTAGAISITAAHGFAMAMNGNARKVFQVPHPKQSTEVAYLNAGRGYYNMVEHLPFFLLNCYLASEATPCIAGVASVLFGVGRILYTKDYAYGGPTARSRGFMMATMSSMACLGVAVCNSVLFPF